MDYEKARQADPANSLISSMRKCPHQCQRMFHLRNGRQLLKDGRAEEAAGEFQKAVRIDPTNKAAAAGTETALTKQAQPRKRIQRHCKRR